MYIQIFPDLLHDILCTQPSPEFGVFSKEHGVAGLQKHGIRDISLMHITYIPTHDHDLVIPQYIMHVTTGSFSLVFQRIDQPKHFGNILAAVNKITYQYQVTVPKGPVI